MMHSLEIQWFLNVHKLYISHEVTVIYWQKGFQRVVWTGMFWEKILSETTGRSHSWKSKEGKLGKKQGGL